MNALIFFKKTFVLFALLVVSVVVGPSPAHCAPDASNNPIPEEVIPLLTGESTFDFGVAHQMDSTQKMLDIQKSTNLEHYLPGIKHIFTLANNSNADLKLGEIDTDAGSIQAEILKNKVPQWSPYVVKAGAKVDIMMAFNYYDVAPGHVRAEIRVMPVKGNKPLAILAMQGIVENDIVPSEKIIDFGHINKKNAYRDFSITFDKRLPLHMLPEVAQVFSSNKHLKVRLLDAGKTTMGIQIKEDNFQLPQGFKQLPDEFVLKVRLLLNDDAPSGELNGEVRLRLVGFPMDQLTENVRIPIRGEVLIR